MRSRNENKYINSCSWTANGHKTSKTKWQKIKKWNVWSPASLCEGRGLCVSAWVGCEKSAQLLRPFVNFGDSRQFMCVFVRMTDKQRARVISPSVCVCVLGSCFCLHLSTSAPCCNPPGRHSCTNTWRGSSRGAGANKVTSAQLWHGWYTYYIFWQMSWSNINGKSIRHTDDRTSMTATPAQIPRITPQFSSSHFSTLVIQPWRRERDSVGGPRVGGRQMAPWSEADMKRAFSKHSLLSLDWASEGKNNRAWLSWGKSEEWTFRNSQTKQQNNRSFLLFAKITLCKHVRCELVGLQDPRRTQFHQEENVGGHMSLLKSGGVEFKAAVRSTRRRWWVPAQTRVSRTVSYTGRSVDRCSHRPMGLMSEPGRDSLRQEHGYRFWELFLIRRLSDQFPGPVHPQHFIWWRRFSSLRRQWLFSQTAETVQSQD